MSSSYNVTSWEVIIVAILIPAVVFLLQVFSYMLRFLSLSLFKSDEPGHLLFLPALLIFGLLILPLILFIFTTCFDLFQEPSNPANLIFSFVLFGGGVLSLAVLVYFDYQTKTLHDLRFENFSMKWGVVSVLFFLSVMYFFQYDKDGSKEQDVEREASFYESPVHLASRSTEWNAKQIVNRLQEDGIKAQLEGTQSLAFDGIEILPEVRVLVSEKDLEEAKDILDEFEEGDSESGA